MERRTATRHVIQHKLVFVELVEQRPIPMVMRDISAMGTNLNIGHYFLPPGKTVYVSFDLSGNDQRQSFRLKAVVVHCTKTNAGLRFAQMDRQTAQLLSEILDQLPATL